MPQTVSAHGGLSSPGAVWHILEIHGLAPLSCGANPCREPFLIGNMPTRLFACSAAPASPARGLHVTVLAPVSTSAGNPRVIQFSGAAPVSLFPRPRRGRARVGVKASGVPRPCFSPHPNLPPPGGKGSKAQGSERKIEN